MRLQRPRRARVIAQAVELERLIGLNFIITHLKHDCVERQFWHGGGRAFVNQWRA